MPITDGYRAIRELYIDMEDTSDPHGSCLGFFFPLADIIWHCTAEEIPAAWQYEHSPVCDGSDRDGDAVADLLITMYEETSITEHDLLAFGEVLHRYSHVIALAGRDY